MTNILKKQSKKSTISTFILMLFIVFSMDVNAQKSSKRVGGGRAKRVRNTSAEKNSSTETSAKNSNEKTANPTEKNTSEITKYNCETLYNKCMNQQCYSETDGRCSCNNSSKFNEIDEKCKYIYNACPNLADNIVATYKRNAKSDCSSFKIADIKNTQTSISNVLASLTDCMKSKCRSKTGEFIGCFDEDNLEKKLKMCEKTYTNVSDVKLLKQMFKDNIKGYKEKYCNEILGTIKSDGECYLNIGFGPSFKDIKKVKEFKIGDDVICSETEFGTSAGESKIKKIRAVKEIALFGVDALASLTNTAGTIVSSFHETVSDKPSDTIGKVEVNENGEVINTGEKIDVYKGTGNYKSNISLGSGVSVGADALLGLVGGQHFGGMMEGIETLKSGDFSYTGYCYVIKGNNIKELFTASDEYYYKLRWGSSDWNTNTSFAGDKE